MSQPTLATLALELRVSVTFSVSQLLNFCAQTKALMLPMRNIKCLVVRSTCVALRRRRAGCRRPPLFDFGRQRVCAARARPAQVALQSRVRHVMWRQLGRAAAAEDAPRVRREAPAAEKFGWVLPVL